LRDELHDLGERYLRRCRARVQGAHARLASSEETNRLLKREAIDLKSLRSAIAGLGAIIKARERLVAELMQILTDAAAASE